MNNFWQKLEKPIFALAPMEEVTGFVFREMFAKYGNPHPSRLSSGHLLPKGEGENNFVMFTEFVNVDGLMHPDGRKKLLAHLRFSEAQRPIAAQLWGRDKEKFYQAARLISELGFDGVDINMGCPQDKEIGQKTCAALIREPALAQEIIRATKKGAGGLPVSVKTRLGYNRPEEITEWIKYLLEAEPAAIAIHGRTKKEKSKAPAHWDFIAKAVEIRDQMFPMSPRPNPHPADAGHLLPEGEGKSVGQRPLIIGNGDIQSREEGLARVKESGVDGVMIGRAAFGNPWLFNPNVVSDASVVSPFMGYPSKADKSAHYISVQEKLRVMLEHAKLYKKTYGESKSFVRIRKHFKAYCSGFPGAHELRVKLMEAKNLEETREIVEEYLKTAL